MCRERGAGKTVKPYCVRDSVRALRADSRFVGQLRRLYTLHVMLLRMPPGLV
jgi:hypothetical protein